MSAQERDTKPSKVKGGLDNKIVHRYNMDIRIKVIPHNLQRYETVGDYWTDVKNQIIEIRVSKLGNWKMEMCVAIHELIEYILCIDRDIQEEDITNFDKGFEDMRKPGNTDEPGDNPSAPYHFEHIFATDVEKQVAIELGVDWNEYEDKIYAL